MVDAQIVAGLLFKYQAQGVSMKLTDNEKIEKIKEAHHLLDKLEMCCVRIRQISQGFQRNIEIEKLSS